MPTDSPAATPRPSPAPRDFRSLFRKLERALVAIERDDDEPRTLEAILEVLLSEFADELGLRGGRIYRREGDDYVVCCGFGAPCDDSPFGFKVPPDYPPHRRVIAEGLVIIRPGQPGYDEAIQRAIGVGSTFAAIAVGKDARFVIAFAVDGDLLEEPVLYALTAIRHVINLKLEREEFTGMLRQASAIQEGMLPTSPPAFPGYEIVGVSSPAELVGGDLHDFLPLSPETLGLAVADASGHGVGAALIARDAITGLRMLAPEERGIPETLARLNDVVHRQALSNSFVSLFYARLETDGRLRWGNAGHNPPLLRSGDTISELTAGGPVLGPIPGARYESGEARLGPGDALLVYTDGLVEQEGASGGMFGVGRLRELLLTRLLDTAQDLVRAVHEAVDTHRGTAPQLDDVTLVVVRRAH